MERIAWEKARPDAQKLAEQGLGDLVAPCPPLTPDALLASQCWTWSGGWAPERWVSFGALHEVPDWSLLIELMQVIRENV